MSGNFKDIHNEMVIVTPWFKWLLNANADFIDASPEIREFVEKVIWQWDEKLKHES